jgi:hypothetical protein
LLDNPCAVLPLTEEGPAFGLEGRFMAACLVVPLEDRLAGGDNAWLDGEAA